MDPDLKPARARRVLSWVAAIALISAAVFFGAYHYRSQIVAAIIPAPGPCQEPIAYTLGAFDQRFGLTQQQFLGVASKAASIWNSALGKDLLEYSATGTLPINLIYDYRQQATDELKSLGLTIDNTKASYNALKARYDSMSSAYKAQKSTLDSLVSAFTAAKSSYEAEVAHWNSVGGAPPAQYAALQKEKESLVSQLAAIDEIQSTMNQEVDSINTIVGILNGLAHTMNMNVQEFNSVGTSTSFDEGEYVRDASGYKYIDIYEFQDQDKLLRVLAHEMGHALGLAHVPDSSAIMYYLNEGSNEKLAPADIAELKQVCGVK